MYPESCLAVVFAVILILISWRKHFIKETNNIKQLWSQNNSMTQKTWSGIKGKMREEFVDVPILLLTILKRKQS